MGTKTLHILLPAGLALAVLAGLTLALAAGAASASTEGAARAPQALPVPYLSDPDVVDAPYGFPSPTVDGYIAPGEYAHADRITYPGYGGYYSEVEVFFVQDGANLYVAFDVAALGPGSNYADVYLDTDLDGDTDLDSSDYMLRLRDDNLATEYTPSAGNWTQVASVSGWTATLTSGLSGGSWQAEFSISLTKLGVTPGTFQEVGLAVDTIDGGVHYWPEDAYSTAPHTWGSLVSSSDWDLFCWKPGPWEDYAPSGMPDFDQHQDKWSTGPISTHCGPVAVANSLWWFDSKFETLTDTMPNIISDSYRLVTSYNTGVWDDHAISNVVPLVDDLANNYFGTNQGLLGTNVISMFHGLHQYLRFHGLWDDYIVTLVEQPDFEWVADEVMRSEDVILLLGFYQDLDPTPGELWERVGGHYVNVAGVNPAGMQIAFSDPAIDAFEQGLSIAGRTLSGTLILPHIPPHGPFTHNDAGNVSHDVYFAVPTNSPGGTWGPELYPWEPFEGWFLGPEELNPHPSSHTHSPYMPGNPIQVEVEFALAVSPYTWKSSGEWEEDPANPVLGTWQPWLDYAINGVPDFDQKQDTWYHPSSLTWSYDGPVAMANSVWWFDGKFEPNPNPPPGPPLAPPNPYPIPYGDAYPMVWSYDTGGTWDDHDPYNVETGVASPMPPPPLPWPPFTTAPGGELVDELAAYFDTDDQLPPTSTLRVGTLITDMYNGINSYLWDRFDPLFPATYPLRQGYVITQVQSPDFWWVAEEVEHSEDVIILMGFWQWQEVPPGSGEWEWVRLGGHYVNLPGVDKQGGLVAFSDPWYDGAEFAWPYAYPAGTPTVLGRVANGWMYLHPPWGHASLIHNDAGNVSHDVYYVVATDSPGGIWGPGGYVEDWEGNFEAQNGGATGVYSDAYPLPQAEVEWAIAVSPVADVWVTKDIEQSSATPGDTITITLTFGNVGSLPAEGVVLTDTLPTGLINPSWTYWTSNGFAVTRQTGTTCTWDLPDLAWEEWGIITVTAELDADAAWPRESTVVNTATIGTSSLEQYQIAQDPNSDADTITVYGPDVAITKTLATSGTLVNGSWVTFTLSYVNNGQGLATNVVITDALVLSLTNASYSRAGALVTPTGSLSYTWLVADLPYGMGGVITVTAQITATFPHTDSLHNEAAIAALGEASLSDNHSGVDVPVTGFMVYLPLVLRSY